MYYRIVYGLILISFSLFIRPLAATPELSLAETPAWVTPIVFSAPEQESPGSVHYHLYDTQVNHSLKTKNAFYQLIMEPLNKQGVEEVSELKFSFFPAYESIIMHDISVIRDGKKTSRLNMEKFKLFQSESELGSKIYSEQWNALFILEDIRPNDIIEYSYSVNGHNPVFDRHDFGSLYLNWNVPLDRIYFSIKSKNKLNYEFTNGDHPVKISAKSGIYTYIIDLKNVTAGPNETQYPYWYEPYNRFQYSGIKSWDEVNKWAMQLYELDYTLPADISSKIQVWNDTLGQKTAINKIIEFVQDDIRYFGIELGVNSHLPRTPKEILQKRYGDCKDKAVLLTAMLGEIDVKAYPALVSSRRGKGIIDDLPSPFAFDHVISYFSFDDKEYWIDGTATSQRGSIQEKGFINYDYALLLKSREKKLHPIQATFENQDLMSTYSTETFNIIPAENSANLKVESTYQGLKAEEFRRFFHRATPKDANSNLINYYSRFYPNISPEKDAVYEEDNGINQVVVKEYYNIKNFASLASARKIFKVFAPTITSYLYKPEKTTRTTPMALMHPVNLVHKVHANISGKILWNDKLDTISIKNQWFEFSRESTKVDENFEITFNYKSLTDHVAPHSITRYLDELDKIERVSNFAFWAKGRKGDTGNAKKKMKSLIKSLIRKSNKE